MRNPAAHDPPAYAVAAVPGVCAPMLSPPCDGPVARSASAPAKTRTGSKWSQWWPLGAPAYSILEHWTSLTINLFPVFCAGDIQGAALFFASKMMVPSEKGLFTTFMAKLSCVGFDLGAPQKVRCISRLGCCAPFDAQFPICRWLVEGCAPCSHSPGAPDGSK